MTYASTFRNIALSSALITGSGLALSQVEATQAPETVNLSNILNATAPSKVHSDAFYQVISQERFQEKPSYSFDITQRCKNAGAISLTSFKDCANKERADDFKKNLALAFGAGAALALIGGLGCAALARAKKECDELGLGTFRHPFE